MKKPWILTALALFVLSGAAYRLVSNKARLEAELEARQRIAVAVPVTTASVMTDSVIRGFEVSGTVGAEKEVVVLSETGGRVRRMLVEVGRRVVEGTPIARLDARVVESQTAMARVSLSNAERDLSRHENLLTTGASTQQSVDQMRLVVEGARANLVVLEKQEADALVRSPVRGTVTFRQAQEGLVLAAGSPVATVSDLSRLVLRVALSDDEMAVARTGTAVRVDVGGREIEARVGTVNLSPDQSGRYVVELRLPAGSSSEARLGMVGTARFRAEATAAHPTIPRQSVVGGLLDPKVYVVESGKARLRKVEIALVSGDRVAIASGLRVGDQLVLSGQMNLADGVDVQVVR